MHLKNYIFALGAALIFNSAVYAQQGIHNPMTQAVLEVYEEQLRENPNDYNVLLNRAEEYFRHTEYLRAMADVDAAIGFIPVNETDTRLHAYILRAGINNATGHPDRALPDLESALALEPQSAQILLQKANTLYGLERYNEAKSDYQRLARLNPRSSDAYIGQAKVAVKENNMGLANELLEQAVTLDPNNADTFMRRAQVRKAMGNHNGAVDDLVLALSINNNDPRAMNALVEYGNTNYPAAMAGLTSAVSAAPQTGMYRYLRAGLAQAHFHYLAALEDYEYIINNRLYNYHGIYASMAECQFALGRNEDALSNIDYALNMERNTASYFCLKSRILRAMGRNEEAVEAAAQALAVNRSSIDALTEMALAYAAVGNYEEANNLLGEAMLNDAENSTVPMLKAWVLEKYMNKPELAKQLYQKVADMDHFYIDNVRSLKGFALLFMGEAEQGSRWMQNILTTVDDTDGMLNYYGACFYAQSGDTEKAMNCAQKSLDLGYANYFNWDSKNDGRITVAPLRDDLRFLNMLSRHNAIFGK